VGLGAALLVSVCGVIWLSAPRETGEQAPVAPRSAQQAMLARGPVPSADRDALARGRELLEAGQALAALKELEAAKAAHGESPELVRLLGEALLKVGQREPGRALLQRYLSEHPEARDRTRVSELLAEP
jgi:thioredoxin-like negative regulator of GroEL